MCACVFACVRLIVWIFSRARALGRMHLCMYSLCARVLKLRAQSTHITARVLLRVSSTPLLLR